MMTPTAEDLLKQITDSIEDFENTDFFGYFSQHPIGPPLQGQFMGMPVFEAPPEPPKIQLSEDVTVSDEFRERMNAWLLERFGRRESVILNSRQVIYAKGLGFVMRPETISVLRMNTTA